MSLNGYRVISTQGITKKSNGNLAKDASKSGFQKSYMDELKILTNLIFPKTKIHSLDSFQNEN